jgi:hypothetical protein
VDADRVIERRIPPAVFVGVGVVVAVAFLLRKYFGAASRAIDAAKKATTDAVVATFGPDIPKERKLVGFFDPVSFQVERFVDSTTHSVFAQVGGTTPVALYYRLEVDGSTWIADSVILRPEDGLLPLATIAKEQAWYDVTKQDYVLFASVDGRPTKEIWRWHSDTFDK